MFQNVIPATDTVFFKDKIKRDIAVGIFTDARLLETAGSVFTVWFPFGDEGPQTHIPSFSGNRSLLCSAPPN